MSNYTIESFGKSDVGLIRNNNEDVFRELPKEKFFVLADGMGGHNAGEVAAMKTVEYLCSTIQNMFLKPLTAIELEELELQMEVAIQNANLWVHHLGLSNPSFRGMGTTLCTALFFKKSIIYSHVGDSRIYRFRKGKLTPLTSDHTVLENPHNVSLSRKVLAKAIGTSIFVTPEVAKDEVEVGDTYLLCSDGLTDLVSDGMIETLLKNYSDLNQVSEHLIETAKEGGGHDNITLLLTRVHNIS